jgi:class 3 adenylate cyclase/alpha-beta hydrolase superfamily lysophospholipase
MRPSQDIRFCTTSDGVSIAYATYGSGYPLIWAPGWITHLERDWFLVGDAVEFLARHFTVIRYDKRGTGMSDRSAPAHDIDARTRDIEAVASALKLRRFALLGVSEGGPIAVSYAAKYPRRVSHLVLMGTYANGSGFTDDDRSRALTTMVRAEWGLATSVFASILVPEANADDRRKFARLCVEGASVDDAIRLLQEIADIDVRPLLSKVKAPTLVLHGKQDQAMPPDQGRVVAAGIPNARLVMVDAGHDFSRMSGSAGDVIRNAVLEHLADVAGDARPAADAAQPERPAADIVAVLFTDLVGHTEVMQRLGDERGRDLLREHERITRTVLGEHGGREVKTLGDGFMASFDSVTAAVDCASALQRAFAARNDAAPPDAPRLDVRVGLNAGEPIAEDGDLFGSTVILASRVAAHAGPGEILIPEPLRHLLSGKTYVYADRGETALKGFDEAVRLYEVRWRD